MGEKEKEKQKEYIIWFGQNVNKSNEIKIIRNFICCICFRVQNDGKGDWILYT